MSAVERDLRPAMSRAECGGLTLRLAGARATLKASGALWLHASRALVVADLHLEKGSAYAARGQLLPPYDTRDALARLARAAQAVQAEILVLLGDSFHDAGGEARLHPGDADTLHALASERRLIWVVGNHDREGPRRLPGEVVETLTLDRLLLVHEPAPGAVEGEIAGHLHPAARVASARGSVRSRCFLTDGRRLILPAFGAYAGGLNVRHRAFDGLFGPGLMACALGRERVHALAFDVLIGD